MSDTALSIAAIGIALASFVFNVFWNLAGRPAPLSHTNLRRSLAYAKGRPAHWRAFRDRRRAQKEEREAQLHADITYRSTMEGNSLGKHIDFRAWRGRRSVIIRQNGSVKFGFALMQQSSFLSN